jgi:hypothetical protein
MNANELAQLAVAVKTVGYMHGRPGPVTEPRFHTRQRRQRDAQHRDGLFCGQVGPAHAPRRRIEDVGQREVEQGQHHRLEDDYRVHDALRRALRRCAAALIRLVNIFLYVFARRRPRKGHASKNEERGERGHFRETRAGDITVTSC